jgi:hypothetical protein
VSGREGQVRRFKIFLSPSGRFREWICGIEKTLCCRECTRNWRGEDSEGLGKIEKDEFEVEVVEYETEDEMMWILNKRIYFPLERLVKAARNPLHNTFVLGFQQVPFSPGHELSCPSSELYPPQVSCSEHSTSGNSFPIMQPQKSV